MTTALTTVTPIVTLKGSQAFTNSRDVSTFFGKEHRHVLDTVDGLIEGGVPGFRQTYKTNGQNGQSYRSFDMTKDGFTLLAMGFTGREALRFKLAYITRFNELEARAPIAMATLPDFSTRGLAAWSWVSLQFRLPPT